MCQLKIKLLADLRNSRKYSAPRGRFISAKTDVRQRLAFQVRKIPHLIEARIEIIPLRRFWSVLPKPRPITLDEIPNPK
jgi:hypothetical protein